MGENNFLWLIYTLLYQNIKTNPWVILRDPQGLEFNPTFVENMAFALQIIACHR